MAIKSMTLIDDDGIWYHESIVRDNKFCGEILWIGRKHGPVEKWKLSKRQKINQLYNSLCRKVLLAMNWFF